MTADHPTREERHAAIKRVRDYLSSALSPREAASGQNFDVGDDDVPLWSDDLRTLAADPAPPQPDAALSDEEREALGCRYWRLDGVWQHQIRCRVPVVESILAVRTAGWAWEHCSPELIHEGISCRLTPRRACACPDGGSHDHLIERDDRADPAPTHHDTCSRLVDRREER